MTLTVVYLETLHCKKAPDRKHPKGSDKVYVAAVTREQGNDTDEPHYLDIRFGARGNSTLQSRRWQYPSQWAAIEGWRAKVTEQLKDGYRSVDWTDGYYAPMEAFVSRLGDFALVQGPAAVVAPAARAPKEQPAPKPGLRAPHEWRPIRRLNTQIIVCATCGSPARNAPMHQVPAAAPASQRPAAQRPPARPPSAPGAVLPPAPPPPPQPVRPPIRERRGRNINLPR